MADSTSQTKSSTAAKELVFAVTDRVRRKNGSVNLGTVKSVREETSYTSAQEDNRGIVVGVQWDNGTHSFFAPEGLEKAS